MTHALKRIARTFLATFLGVVVTQGGFTLTQTDLALLRSAVAAGIASIVTAGLVLLESKAPAISTGPGA